MQACTTAGMTSPLVERLTWLCLLHIQIKYGLHLLLPAYKPTAPWMKASKQLVIIVPP